MITLQDAEVFAERDLRRAELDGHDAPPWAILLARLDVLVAEFGSDSPIRGDGTHGVVRGQPVVYIHERLPPRGRAFVALHEYGHVVVEDERLELGCHVERWCNRFAAALLCPPSAARRAWREGSADLLAAHRRCAVLGGTAFALRMGEVGIASVRIFENDHERYAEPADQPADGLPALARAAGKMGYAEAERVRAWRLPDTPHRVAVLVDRMAA